MSDEADAIRYAGYVPGVLGAFVALQARWYAKHWDFDAVYEAKIAGDAAAFLTRLDPARDAILSAWLGERPIGAISVDGSEDDGPLSHLRWFVVDEAARGRGVGRALLDKAVAFARDSGAAGLYLTTFDGLKAARALYDAAGFEVVHEAWDTTWGKRVLEQRMERHFSPARAARRS